MIIKINGRPVHVADNRRKRVLNKLAGFNRRDRNLSRELKHAGLGPTAAGNSLAFQTGSNYYGQTDK